MPLQAKKSHQKKTVYVTLNTCDDTLRQWFLTVSIPRLPQNNCPFLCSKPPDIKKVVETSVFVDKFVDQTFYVVERVKARAPLEIY